METVSQEAVAAKILAGTKFEAWEVTSDLKAAAEHFVAFYEGDFAFVVDLKKSLKKGLSAGQAKGALNVLLAQYRREMAKAELANRPPAADLSTIPPFLAAAGDGKLAYPKFHFVVGTEEFVLRFKRKGVHTGAVDIVSKDKVWNDRFQSDMPRWFGRIEADGSLTRGGQLTVATEAAIAAIADDPFKAAAEYGKLTGACSFCGRELTDARSTEVGYGPVCAKKYGRPWG